MTTAIYIISDDESDLMVAVASILHEENEV
jgi:hypothetical protein